MVCRIPTFLHTQSRVVSVQPRPVYQRSTQTTIFRQYTGLSRLRFHLYRHGLSHTTLCPHLYHWSVTHTHTPHCVPICTTGLSHTHTTLCPHLYHWSVTHTTLCPHLYHWSVTHTTLAVLSSPTTPRAHPAVLSPAHRSQDTVLAPGARHAEEVMRFLGTACNNSSFHSLHQYQSLRLFSLKR